MNFQKLKNQAVEAVKSEAIQFGGHMLERAKQAARERVYDLIGPDGRHRKSSTLRTFATFVGGLTIGAGLALVLTPMTGRQTRTFIATFGKQLLASKPVEDASNKGKAEAEQITDATPAASSKSARGRGNHADSAKDAPQA